MTMMMMIYYVKYLTKSKGTQDPLIHNVCVGIDTQPAGLPQLFTVMFAPRCQPH